MKPLILYLSTLCFCFVFAFGVEAHQRQEQRTSQPKGSQMQQMDQGYALTVLSVRRASEWTPGTALMRIVPTPGGALHIIRVRVTFLGAKDDYLFSYEKVPTKARSEKRRCSDALKSVGLTPSAL